MKSYIVLILIILLGIFLRLHGLNWDQGFHLHPDERAIVMFTTPLQFPKTITEFLSPQSLWNPHFFAYGSFPLYFLKTMGSIASGIDPLYATYDKINLLGRFLSATFDIGTLTVLFFLARKLFNRNVGLITAFLYAVSVLPIQLSHFYAVDTSLTFFVLITLYQSVRLYEKPTFIKSILVGFFFGLSLATKTSALVLIASIGMAISVDFFLIFLKNPHRPHIWFPHIPKFLKRLCIDGLTVTFITFLTFIIFEPYAIIDFQTFWQQTLQQSQMTHDAFIFPYTLQYVGKIPYWYELKNIFLWGQGPLLAFFSFLGTLYVTFSFFKPSARRSHSATPPRWPNGLLGGETHGKQIIILLTFFWIYFLVVGKFAIGFMRYMLPLYPLLCLFASIFFMKLLSSIPQKLYAIRYTLYAFALCAIIWPLSFIHIYSQPNTRVSASNWINKNIPLQSTIALEHWDDGLPLSGQQNYHVLTLPLYDSDTPQKWAAINQQLSQTDYIIIASNRLYVPLIKMTDCERLPIGRCYTQTAAYYKKLFAGDLGFKKIAEFSISPSFIIHNSSFIIDDSSADESFTVYDHPKIMIFKHVQ